MSRTKGIFFTMLSAVSFGIMPIIAVYAYRGNCNAFTLCFLRSFFAIIILLPYLKYKKVSLKLSKDEIVSLLSLSLVGNTLTTLMLFLSYNYIPVGMATTLHFTYPVIVTFICIAMYKEKVNRKKIITLLLSFVGILMFFENSAEVSYLGIFLSVASGFTYSYYIVYLSRSILKGMNIFKLTYYISIITAISIYISGMLMGKISFGLTPTAWVHSFIIAILSGIIGLVCMQIGIRIVGPSTASILSTFEPITSMLLGVLILNEAITLKIIIGSIMIIASVILITLEKKHFLLTTDAR